MKYLERLKSEKRAVEALPKLPKDPFDSKDSTHSGRFQKNTPVSEQPLPDWQHDFCIAHADFNHWRGRCPVSLDDCIISEILESVGDMWPVARS